MGKGIERDVETPAQQEREDVPEGFSLNNDEEENEKYAPDAKGMNGFGNKGIPDGVPERVMHPFHKAPIGKRSRYEPHHVNHVGEDAPQCHFPCPGFSIEEGKAPEEVLIRSHRICPLRKPASPMG
jgi:hypothetical protein